MGLFNFNSKKYILLDIDGVFNSLGVIDSNNRTIVSHTYGNWQITNENVEFLKWLSTQKVKIYWISTWKEVSNELNRALNIPYFKTIFKTSKHDTVQNFIRDIPNFTVLVVDDEYKSISTKYIVPDSKTGLTEEDRLKIKEFILNK